MSDSGSGDVSKLIIGGITGFSLYLLAAHLGFGGGRGDGSSGSQRSKDEHRLTFTMTLPTKSPYTQPMAFALSGEPSRTYSVDELIARVKDGGRVDVTLKIRGDVLQGAADAARKRVKDAGLELWEEKPASSPSVSGNARGVYGRGRYV
jgi:hypothetical protein